MSTQVQDRLKDMSAINSELISLVCLENPTPKQMKRMADLKSGLNAIKAGSSLADVRNYELEELRRESGLPRLPDAPRTRIGVEIESEWRKFALGQPFRESCIPRKEFRANEAGTQSIFSSQGPAGGYFVAPGMHDRLWYSMRQWDMVLEDWAHYDIQTATGSVLPAVSADDISNASVLTGEGIQSGEVDVANFGSAQLQAYTYRTKIVAVTLELLQDANFSVAETLERCFAHRHALGFGNACVRGSGSSQPLGVLTATVASGAVPVIASGSSTNTGAAETGANSWGTNDAFAVYKQLDPALRPGAVWCMADSTLQYLASLLDKMGRPIFPNQLLGDGKEVYLLGHRVAISPSMPAIGSGNNSVVFYQPNNLVIRTVPAATYVQKFWQNPTLIQFGLVGFSSFLRGDSNLVAPNQNYLPSAYLQHHS